MKKLQELVDSLLVTPFFIPPTHRAYNLLYYRCYHLSLLWCRYFEFDSLKKQSNGNWFHLLEHELDRFINLVMGSNASIMIDHKAVFLFDKNCYIFVPYSLMTKKELSLVIDIVLNCKEHFKSINFAITLPIFRKPKYEVNISVEQRRNMVAMMLNCHVIPGLIASLSIVQIQERKQYLLCMVNCLDKLNQFFKNFARKHLLLFDTIYSSSLMCYHELFNYANLLFDLLHKESNRWE